jgi:mannose-1-phosphate guanylyltransferase
MGSMAAVQEQADQDGGRLSRESRYGRGVFSPLTHLRARDPEATAVIYPSDHVVQLEVKFIEELRHAAWTAERYEGWRCLAPHRIADNWIGWIQPGSELGTVGGCQIRGTLSS